MTQAMMDNEPIEPSSNTTGMSLFSSVSNPIMQLAADLNGAGAVSLAYGDVDRAMVYFSNALATFKLDKL